MASAPWMAVKRWWGAVGEWSGRHAAVIGLVSAAVGFVSAGLTFAGLVVSVGAYRDANEQSRAAESAAANLRDEAAKLRLLQEI